MANMPRAEITRFRSRQFVAMLVFVVATFSVGVAISFVTQTSHPELSKVFAEGAATVLFGAAWAAWFRC